MKEKPGKETEKLAGAKEAISLYNKLLKDVDLQTEEEQTKQQNDIKHKAKELLKIEDIGSIYDQLIEQPEYAEFEPAMLLKEIILRFGEGQEIEQLQQEYDKALDTDLFKRVRTLLSNKEKLEQNIGKLPDSEGPRAVMIIRIINDYLATTFNILSLQVLNTALQLHSEGRLYISQQPDIKEFNYVMKLCNAEYLQAEKAIARMGFFTGGSQWPEADISGGIIKEGKLLSKPKPKNNVAFAELQERARKGIVNLSGQGRLAQSMLTIIMAKYMEQATSPEDKHISFTVDDFLEARAIKKKKGGSGRRGGYDKEQRKAVEEQIDLLDSLFVDIASIDTPQGTIRKHGRVLDIAYIETLNNQITAWDIRPGDIYRHSMFTNKEAGITRQVALLHKKLISYRYDTHRVEIDLGYYLCGLWRIEKEPYKRLKVKTLLKESDITISTNKPSRTKQRLDKALNRLKKDGIIHAWRYEKAPRVNKQGWWRQWTENIIVITAPEEIAEHYQSIRKQQQNYIEQARKRKQKPKSRG